MSCTELDHVQLAAPPDCETEARCFFGDVLGFEEVAKPVPLRSRGGVWFRCGSHQLHIGVENEFSPALKAHPAFRVGDEDLERLAERLRAAGARAEWDDTSPGLRRLYTADPWGNRIEFLARLVADNDPPRYPPASQRLTREQFLRVIQLADDLQMEAARCADTGAFYAACLMASCALEAMLLANVLALEPEMERDGTWPSSKKPPEKWHLLELVRFHLDHGWIPADDPAAPQLGEAVEAMNELRNVVAHPGRLIRDAPQVEFDESVFAGMFGVLQATFAEIPKRLYPDED